MEPQWANVYNRVTVSLRNSEFGGVTSKEVAAGSYLEMVSHQTLSVDPEDVLNFN
jgi:pterin-4a-carbinolamine dehydratase